MPSHGLCSVALYSFVLKAGAYSQSRLNVFRFPRKKSPIRVLSHSCHDVGISLHTLSKMEDQMYKLGLSQALIMVVLFIRIDPTPFTYNIVESPSFFLKHLSNI
jgi:hypothetical protein